ncbi:MAG: SPOR domain-containing protein [Anaerolineales bacterium]|nr:SPOR domain-containing protein [Anaerolineales bacterium]
MNIQELEKRLQEEGCNPGYYAIGSRGGASDAHCLTHNGREWQVYYTERGVDSAPEFTSPSEEEACEYFFNFMMKFRHDHCIGVFLSQSLANELQAKLESHGLRPFQDKIPTPVVKEPLYRVWVSGKEIFTVKEVLGTTHITDKPK